MVDEFGERDLRLEHVLLRDAADGVLDPCRLHTLARQRHLLVVDAHLLVVALDGVESGAHAHHSVALHGLQLRLGDGDLLARDLPAQRALAWSREVLADHEHVLRLVEVVGRLQRDAPGAVHERGIIQRAGCGLPSLGNRDTTQSQPDLGVIPERRSLRLFQAGLRRDGDRVLVLRWRKHACSAGKRVFYLRQQSVREKQYEYEYVGLSSFLQVKSVSATRTHFQVQTT